MGPLLRGWLRRLWDAQWANDQNTRWRPVLVVALVLVLLVALCAILVR
jgi:hypothetical protein